MGQNGNWFEFIYVHKEVRKNRVSRDCIRRYYCEIRHIMLHGQREIVTFCFFFVVVYFVVAFFFFNLYGERKTHAEKEALFMGRITSRIKSRNCTTQTRFFEVYVGRVSLCQL